MTTIMTENTAVVEMGSIVSLKHGLKGQLYWNINVHFMFMLLLTPKAFFIVPGLGNKKNLYYNQQREHKCGNFF